MNQEQSHYFEELIPVVYGRDLAEANYYRSLLDDHEIPAIINEEAFLVVSDEEKSGIPVLVPDEHLAEAQDILEQITAEDEVSEDDPDDFDDEVDEFADFQEEDADLGGV